MFTALGGAQVYSEGLSLLQIRNQGMIEMVQFENILDEMAENGEWLEVE